MRWAHVTAVKMHVPSETPGYVDRIVGPEEIDGAVAGCDLLVLTLPHTEKTHHILDSAPPCADEADGLSVQRGARRPDRPGRAGRGAAGRHDCRCGPGCYDAGTTACGFAALDDGECAADAACFRLLPPSTRRGSPRLSLTISGGLPPARPPRNQVDFQRSVLNGFFQLWKRAPDSCFFAGIRGFFRDGQKAAAKGYDGLTARWKKFSERMINLFCFR